MLKPLTTIYREREITLECTHKREFPPPQMYGHTPEDIDNLWKQGAIDQNQHQHLKVWKDKCGLMVMGPRCLDCPLALKQNPRPGRPHVIETEPWLPLKERMRWDDMKAGKLAPPAEPKVEDDPEPVEVVSEETVIPEPEPEVADETLPDETVPEPAEEEEEEEPKGSLLDALENPDEVLAEAEEPAEEPEPEPEPEPSGLGDDILDALAED
jgi:hypothetical protein